MKSGDQQGGAGDLPELVLATLHAIGRYFGAGDGPLTLELRYSDGSFEKWYRHESGGIEALGQFVES